MRSNAEREYRKRRRKMMREVIRQPYLYELIDGNLSHYPVAYCKWRKAYLSKGLTETHGCGACVSSMFFTDDEMLYGELREAVEK